MNLPQGLELDVADVVPKLLRGEADLHVAVGAAGILILPRDGDWQFPSLRRGGKADMPAGAKTQRQTA
jgi:hypothetical protein